VLGACAEPPQVRYFLLSKYIPAKQLLRIVRSHWGIENQLHWVLDVVFNEDRNRTRKDNAPENLAILRKLALNLVRSHPAATRKSNERDGTTPSSWACSVICDSPAPCGGG
jgi:predicted transposase YbfD/YdcC